jgi:hypothetical protein
LTFVLYSVIIFITWMVPAAAAGLEPLTSGVCGEHSTTVLPTASAL